MANEDAMDRMAKALDSKGEEAAEAKEILSAAIEILARSEGTKKKNKVTGTSASDIVTDRVFNKKTVEEAVTTHQEKVAKNPDDYVWCRNGSYAVPKTQFRWCWECGEKDNWKMMFNFFTKERPQKWCTSPGVWNENWFWEQGSQGEYRGHHCSPCYAESTGADTVTAKKALPKELGKTNKHSWGSARSRERVDKYKASFTEIKKAFAGLVGFALDGDGGASWRKATMGVEIGIDPKSKGAQPDEAVDDLGREWAEVPEEGWALTGSSSAAAKPEEPAMFGAQSWDQFVDGDLLTALNHDQRRAIARAYLQIQTQRLRRIVAPQMNLIICKKRDMNKAVACANVYSDWLCTDTYGEMSDFTLKEDQQFCHNIQESMTANAERMQGFSKAVEAGHGKPGQYQLVCDYSDQFLATDKGRMNTYYCCGGKTGYNMEKKKH
ncbi:unnamed protein product, partial [Prorocentrum cordatum]